MSGVLALAVLARGAEEHPASLRIEPAIERVPANHLKFYLHFSEPMERGEAFRYLRLVRIDEAGREMEEVPEPFREIELWDESFTRMTLWFHPGRQKPGVNLNVEIGPILVEGNRYRLEVSPDWKTERGTFLGGRLEAVFEAGPIDEEQPEPESWKHGYSVDAEGRNWILIHTDGALDPASAARRIAIFRGDDRVAFELRGSRLAILQEKGKGDRLRVVVDPLLEDLAGNSVARPFNLDLQSNPDFRERTKPVELVFPRKISLPPGPSFPGDSHPE